jgi:FkbM family methyltransferase
MAFSISDVLGADWPHISIVDVGAMDIEGEQVPYKALMRSGRFEVIGFEAVKTECDKLNASGRTGHRYVNCIVGDGTRRKFTQTNASMTSSLYAPNRPLLELFNNLGELTIPVSSQEVQTRRLDDIPELSGVRVDLLKIDIQGAEADVFAGASKLLRNVVVVHTEVEFVPLYQGQPLYGDVARVLHKAGFLHHGFLGVSGRTFKPLVNNNDVNLPLLQNLWSDVLFVRDFTRLHELSGEQLLRMAVILHECYGSVDLAQLCLAHHDRKAGTRYWDEYLARLLGRDPSHLIKPA